MVLIVAAIGRSGSGKTVTIEYLVRQLSAEGYAVGVIKHVHHKGFTIDTEGKNTWRYAQAGATVVAAVSPDEVAIVKKTVQGAEGLDPVIEALRRELLDVIFVEGYRDLIAKRGDVLKILTAADDTFLQEMLEGTVEPIIAISGIVAKNTNKQFIKGHLSVKIPEEGKILVDLIKQALVKHKQHDNEEVQGD